MIRVLFRKEIRLQRGNILFALAVCGVWGIAFLLGLSGNRPLYGKLLTTGALSQFIHYFFVVPCLFLIFPLLAGSSAVTQERKMGTLGWQLSFPVSRGKQWMVKAGAAVGLALFMGGLLTVILDGILVFILKKGGISTVFGSSSFPPDPLSFRGLSPLIYAMFFASAGAYLSSISNNPYRALMSCFVFLILTSAVCFLLDPTGLLNPLVEGLPRHFFHPWIHYLGIALICLVLLGLGIPNFRPSRPPAVAIAKQLAFYIACVCIANSLRLSAEYNVRPLIEKEKPPTAGFFKLIGAGHYRLKYSLYQIPGRTKIATIAIDEKADKEYGGGRPGRYGTPGRIVEIDWKTGGIKQIRNLQGRIQYMDPGGRFFTVSTGSGHLFPVCGTFLGYALPPLSDIGETLFPGGRGPSNKFILKYMGSFSENISIKTPDKVISRHPYINMKAKNGFCVVKTWNNWEETWEYFLLRENPGGPYSIMEKGREPFFISPGGNWYASSFRTTPGKPPITITSTRGDRSHEIKAEDCLAMISPFPWQYNSRILQDEILGIKSYRLMFSKDDRFLAFYRRKETEKNHDLQVRISVCLLDTRTGGEILLGEFPADPLFHRMQINVSFAPEEYMPPMAWSGDHTLAFLNGSRLHIFNISPENGRCVQTRVFPVPMGDKGWPAVSLIDFVAPRVLLVWGSRSIWKLEL